MNIIIFSHEGNFHKTTKSVIFFVYRLSKVLALSSVSLPIIRSDRRKIGGER